MIENWSQDDGLLEHRKLCLGCFARKGVSIDRSVYEFSDHFVKSGRLEAVLPTKDNLLQDEVAEYDGDYFRMACDVILKAYQEWK